MPEFSIEIRCVRYGVRNDTLSIGCSLILLSSTTLKKTVNYLKSVSRNITKLTLYSEVLEQFTYQSLMYVLQVYTVGVPLYLAKRITFCLHTYTFLRTRLYVPQLKLHFISVTAQMKYNNYLFSYRYVVLLINNVNVETFPCS